MPSWIVLIIVISLIGGLITEYQKNKMKMMSMGEQNEQEVEDLRKLVNTLKTRIENLEAIAAGEPDEFKTGSGAGMSEIEIEESSIKDENQQKVSDLANKQRG